MNSGFILVLATASSTEEAQAIAMKLIRARLAPCVNILSSCTSIYQWKEEICTEGEVLMLIKSQRQLFDEVVATVEQAHSYDVPEIIAMDIADVSSTYGGYLSSFLEGS